MDFLLNPFLHKKNITLDVKRNMYVLTFRFINCGMRIYFKFSIIQFYINLAAFISDNKYESVNWKTLYI